MFTLRNRHGSVVRRSLGTWALYSRFAVTQDVGFVGLRLLSRGWTVEADMVRAWRLVLRALATHRRRRAQLRGVMS